MVSKSKDDRASKLRLVVAAGEEQSGEQRQRAGLDEVGVEIHPSHFKDKKGFFIK